MWNLASRAKPYFGAVVLTAALLTAGGIYSALRIPSGVYPEVTFPRLAVVAKKPGLAVPNMEAMVTRPLEQAVSEVIGVERVRAKTIRGGCDISVDLAPGTDIARAELLAWNRIGAARSLMPPDVTLTVERMTPAVFPIMSVVLSGGDSPSQLRDYAYYQFAPRLKNIADVYRASVAGGDFREIEVVVKPDSLLAAGLSTADLADQIGKAHRLQPVGRIEQGRDAYTVIVNTQGTSAREIEDLLISTKSNQPLRVRDVASVKVLYQDRMSSVGFAGQDAVVATVFRSPGGNTLNISCAVQELLDQNTLPANIKATVVYDQARFVSTAIDNVRDAILIGGLFSILILLAFLRSWRATLISALAIPTTLAITFLFLHWYGETLNLMSLGGLAVAIGLIIDDTVVVVENIARHLTPAHKGAAKSTLPLDNGPTMVENPVIAVGPLSKSTTPLPSGKAVRDGHPPVASSGNGQATADSHASPAAPDPIDAASGEITGAVIGSTLTTVLVFVPLAFMAGVYGQFFASLSRALSVAVLVSMVISLTLVPVFAAKFLAGKPMPEPGRIYHFFANVYEFFLAIALRFPWITLTFSLAAVLLGFVLSTGIPDPRSQKADDKPLMSGVQTGLMPAMDEGAFVVDYFAPMGTPLQRTEAMAHTIERILLENPDVQVYVRRTGTQLGLAATKTNRGDIQVVLRPAEDDPLSLLRKPVRPPLEEIEKEMAELGQQAAARKYGPTFTEQQAREEGKTAIARKYRRRPLKDIMDEIDGRIKECYSEHQLKFELIQIMEDELNDLSGSNRPIEVKLFGPNYGELRRLGTEIADKLAEKGKDRGLKEVNSNVFEGNPDLMIEVDKVRAANLGLPAQEVERQLHAAYFGQIATQVQESAERMTDVRVRYPDSLRFGVGGFSPDSVLSPWILLPGNAPPGAPGGPTISLSGLARAVPLSAVARVNRIRTPDEQVRENLQPALIINAQIDEDKTGLGAAVADIRRWMADVPLPSGYRWELGGHYLKQQEAFFSLALVMVVAILLVFIMLAFQFRSVVLPLLIFLTQPLSLVSGLFALWITNTPLNVSSYMGAILLIGLDMKNGILLVEYIQQLRGEGMELRQALLLAGRTRFRPILMTSLAAILGLFPLALGIGPGAQMQQPLAIMVIGGLTANMLFTRMVIPVGYLVLERRKVSKAGQPIRVPLSQSVVSH